MFGLWFLTQRSTIFQLEIIVEETGENHQPAASH
jgi:hypothetical protein